MQAITEHKCSILCELNIEKKDFYPGVVIKLTNCQMEK